MGYRNEDDDNFGAHQGWEVQGNEFIPPGNGKNPVVNQVRMRSGFNMLGTNLRNTKVSEVNKRNVTSAATM
jgi:hypothetical protein